MANLQSFERTDYQQVKADLHRKILDRLDLEKLGKAAGNSARDEVLVVIRNAVNSEVVPLSFAERERLSREILDEIFGLGPLEPLLKDPNVSDILVNRFDRVYIERAGKLELTLLSFKDNVHLMQIIERIVSRVGRRVDESEPMCDARLKDGSRKVVSITEVIGMEGEMITVQEIFKFESRGADPSTGKIIGDFEPTGIRPRIIDRLFDMGIPLPPRLAQIFPDRRTVGVVNEKNGHLSGVA